MASKQTPPVADLSDEADAPSVLDAVVIVKKSVDGRIETEVALNGNVQPTEVQTLIELGLKKWRSQLGL